MKHNGIVAWGLVALALFIFFPGLARAQSNTDRLTVHGYLTQGYAGSSDVPIYGIGTDGTFDYRAAALQFRLNISERDDLVFQLSHRRLGGSPLQEGEPAIDFDWGFYQYRWGGGSMRIGKVPMPRGLFNEVRDVGVLLPFYRASAAFYSEGVETIDGVSISSDLSLGNWFVDWSVFGGAFDLKTTVATNNGQEIVNQRYSNAIGGKVTLNTPIPGLRFSSDINYSQPPDEGVGDATKFLIWTGSADASFDRWYARAEYQDADLRNEFTYTAWYAQAGLRLWQQLWLNGQAEFNTNELVGSGYGPLRGQEYDAIQDYAVGLQWRVTSNFVLKAEYHDFEGYAVDEIVIPVLQDPVSTNYFIFSVATAF